jgi:serine/threonine-protein kinase RsbW
VDSRSEILIIKSDEREIRKVESFLFEYFRKWNCPMRNFNKVLLCISEAIMNAIHHGNKNDLAKTVAVKILYDNDLIFAEIIDEGKGFNFNCITDPTKDEFIKRESGRGLHIIKSLCECIEFSNNGSCVRIKIEVK